MIQLFTTGMVIMVFVVPGHVMAQAAFKFPNAVTRDKNQITIGVYPQVELISIVQTIGKYPNALGFLMAKGSSQYKSDVIDHFKPYADHPAVLMFDRLALQPRMLNFSAPSNIMLYTDKHLHVRDDIALDDFVINRAGGMDSLKVFLNLLRDFANQSSFNEFFLQHSDFYSNIAKTTISTIDSINYVSELENFYGKKQKSYHIILVSLYNFVGFGNSLLYSNGQRELYNTMGPKNVANDVPSFGDLNYLKQMIRHEFSHPFINPLTEKYWYCLEGYSHKYDSIPEVARKNVCGDWQECVNEFIIRAITTHIDYNESKELGSKSYEREKSRGVSYLDSLMDEIAYYQTNRDNYPTLESYYLKLLDVFKGETVGNIKIKYHE